MKCSWSASGMLRLIESLTSFVNLASLAIAAAVLVVWASLSDPNQKSHPLDAEHAAPRSSSCFLQTLSVSEDDQYLDVVYRDLETRNTVWRRRDGHTGRELFQEPLCQDHFWRLQFCAQDRTWAGITMDDRLEIHRDGRSMWTGALPDQAVNETLVACTWCPRTGCLVVASRRGTLWFFQVEEDQAVLGRHYAVEKSLRNALLSPQGDRVALVTDNGDVLIWDIAEERVSVRLPAESHRHVNVSWSGNGRRIIVFQGKRSDQKVVTIWDSLTAQALRQWTVEYHEIKAAALNEEGTRAAVGDGEVIRLWDVETGAEDPPLIGHAAMISVLQFADQGRTLFSSDLNGELRRWSITDGREIWNSRNSSGTARGPQPD